jgi:hypothetical protein
LGEKTPHVDKAGKEERKTQGILYSGCTGDITAYMKAIDAL